MATEHGGVASTVSPRIPLYCQSFENLLFFHCQPYTKFSYQVRPSDHWLTQNGMVVFHYARKLIYLPAYAAPGACMQCAVPVIIRHTLALRARHTIMKLIRVSNMKVVVLMMMLLHSQTEAKSFNVSWTLQGVRSFNSRYT